MPMKQLVLVSALLSVGCGNDVDGRPGEPSPISNVAVVTPSSACDPGIPEESSDDPADQPSEAPDEPTPGSATAYNILVRGQSNAYLFVEWGGVWAMRAGVAAALGIDEDRINIVADTADAEGHNTIYSGTGFIGDWMDGESPLELEQSLLAAIADMSDDAKVNPTLVLWMHNEYDQQHEGITQDMWLTSARADGHLVRDALGQAAARTPYFYVWVPYGYAANGGPEAVRGGMQTLVDDSGFHASFGTDIQASDMGDASHMSWDGVQAVGARLAPEVAAILRRL